MTNPSLAVLRVPISSLNLDPSNARLHGDLNLDAITASLVRFGQAEPLVVQAVTRRVIAGNGRLVAMKKLGWTECDIVELEVDDLKATALGIALNRTAELAEWDGPVLARLLDELRTEGALDGVGYTTDDLDALIAEVQASTPGEVDDQGPEEPPEKPISRVGDLWVLGDHRLQCGDSTNALDVKRLMAGETAALLSTDPPYAIGYTGNDRPVHDGKPSGKDWSALYNEVHITDLAAFLDLVFSACLPHVAQRTAVYVWHAHVQYPNLLLAFEKHDLIAHQQLIWSKPSATFGHSYYRYRHEPCLFGWRKGFKPAHGYGDAESIWEADWDGKARITTFHPTSKPTRLFEIPMEQHTKPGDVVLEPFSGSGSQIIAAEKLTRRCRAMELSPAFVDGTILRWQKATSREAILDGTSQSFQAITKERAA